MKKTTLLLTLLLLIWTGLLSPLAGADEPVVRALLFWSENCAHCHAVIAETLPPLQERYGSQLDVRTVEVSDPTRYELWRSVIETFQVPPERMAVPMLVIGDSVLVGSYEISEALPGLIEQHLATGGVDYPAIPGLLPPGGLTPQSGTPTPQPVAPRPPIHLAYFYQPGCRECDRVQLDLNYLQHEYPQLVVHAFDVKAEAALAEWLGQRAGIPEEKRLTAPAVFVADEGLVGEEVHARSLEALIARHTATGAGAVWEGREATRSEAASSIVERFRPFGLLTVLAAGLVDGLNPCAFATIVFFISYLAFVGRRRREVLAVGVAFTVGVFLTYLGVGVGLLRFLATLPFLSLGLFIHRRAAAIKLTTAGLFVLLAGWLVTSLI
jgi:hypothetical protein